MCTNNARTMLTNYCVICWTSSTMECHGTVQQLQATTCGKLTPTLSPPHKHARWRARSLHALLRGLRPAPRRRTRKALQPNLTVPGRWSGRPIELAPHSALGKRGWHGQDYPRPASIGGTSALPQESGGAETDAPEACYHRAEAGTTHWRHEVGPGPDEQLVDTALAPTGDTARCPGRHTRPLASAIAVHL